MTKRRGAGEGHIEKITLRSGNKAYRGWVVVGYKPDGTSIRRTAQRRTKTEVQDALVRLYEKYRPGRTPCRIDLQAETTMRLSVLFDKWLAHFKSTQEHKGRTPGTYTWAINKAKAQLGDPLVALVSALELQDAITVMGGALKPKSLNLIRVVLKGSFHQAQLWKIRSDNPAENLKLPRAKDGDADDRRIIGAEDALRLFYALMEERNGLSAAFTYALGIRPSEAAALRCTDVDLDAGTVTIEGGHNIVEGVVEREKTKSKRGKRPIPLPPELRPWVIRHLAKIRIERMAMGERWTASDEGLLFVRESDGGKLSNHQVYYVARRAAERAGLGKVGPRILRRSMLSALAKAGVESKVRAAIGGHTKVVTDEYYREVDAAEVSDAMGHMSRILAPLAPPAGTEDEE